METKFELKNELRKMEKLIKDFTYGNGMEIRRVFDDFLTWIIGYHYYTLTPRPIEGWQYTPEQNVFFARMYREWLAVMHAECRGEHDWCDAFGELYEAMIAAGSHRSNTGQFFTPVSICDLIAQMNIPEEPLTGKRISDPCSGSGRLLLAWHVRNPGNKLYAEDIDRTCCMMTVCNFIIHGCRGEVVWHDSLNPESYYGGWKVNENLVFGLPGCREIRKEESLIWRMWEARRHDYVQPEIPLALPAINQPGQASQLTMF